MKLTKSNRRTNALTLVEILVILVVGALLIAIFIQPPDHSKSTAQWAYCVNNLKQVGMGFRVWPGDQSDRYPMQVTTKIGGAMEPAVTGNVAAVFQVMSNEFTTPKVLHCPADVGCSYATNFTVNFGRSNISYFIGLDAAEEYPNVILSGDDNLAIRGVAVKSGVMELTTNTPITWTTPRHRFRGNVLLTDGSVQTVSNSDLVNIITNQYAGPSGFTNRFRLAIP